MDKTCKNCKYWDQSKTLGVSVLDRQYGECLKLRWDFSEDVLFDRVIEGRCAYPVLFGKNFGCLHFEDK